MMSRSSNQRIGKRTVPVRRIWRKFRAGWRDTLLLLREFRRPLLLFLLLVAGSGWLYYFLARLAGQPLNSLAGAVYHTLTLSFLQPTLSFPSVWYLQIFYFLMPVLGVSILAQGLTDFGTLLFNRRARGKEWEMAVASTFNQHIVVVGLGHLGYRVVKTLKELDQDVVVIEKQPKPDLLESIRSLDVPVIVDDGAREAALIGAGVPQARAILLCTQDDSLNLKMALKARSLNPRIEVTMRIFDDDFAASLQAQFGFQAISATGMAAPMFAAIAAHVDITPPITIGGQPHVLANLLISSQSRMQGKTVFDIEEAYRVSVVLLCKDGTREFHPAGTETILPGQTVAIFGDAAQINRLIHENNRSS